VLELVKQGVVEVDQATGNFGTIVVIWASEADVPVAELVTADAYEG
jgi:chromatin segregation and condensation protein Rec8/ScpA/Scc1 (kleisin family)